MARGLPPGEASPQHLDPRDPLGGARDGGRGHARGHGEVEARPARHPEPVDIIGGPAVEEVVEDDRVRSVGVGGEVEEGVIAEEVAVPGGLAAVGPDEPQGGIPAGIEPPRPALDEDPLPPREPHREAVLVGRLAHDPAHRRLELERLRLAGTLVLGDLGEVVHVEGAGAADPVGAHGLHGVHPAWGSRLDPHVEGVAALRSGRYARVGEPELVHAGEVGPADDDVELAPRGSARRKDVVERGGRPLRLGPRGRDGEGQPDEDPGAAVGAVAAHQWLNWNSFVFTSAQIRSS